MNVCNRTLTFDAIVLARAVCFCYALRGNWGEEQQTDFVRLWKRSYFQCSGVKCDPSVEGWSRSDFMRATLKKIIALGFVPGHAIAFTCTSD